MGRNPIVSESRKTAKRKVQRLHVVKIGAYVRVDRRQTDTPKLHKTSNKLPPNRIRIIKYKVAYLRTSLEGKWNWRLPVVSSAVGRTVHCDRLKIQWKQGVNLQRCRKVIQVRPSKPDRHCTCSLMSPQHVSAQLAIVSSMWLHRPIRIYWYRITGFVSDATRCSAYVRCPRYAFVFDTTRLWISNFL